MDALYPSAREGWITTADASKSAKQIRQESYEKDRSASAKEEIYFIFQLARPGVEWSWRDGAGTFRGNRLTDEAIQVKAFEGAEHVQEDYIKLVTVDARCGVVF